MVSVRPEVLAFYDNMAMHIIPVVILAAFLLFYLVKKRKSN